jgi:ADP-ribose pyrophosphatase YjhB (NUDIX family)
VAAGDHLSVRPPSPAGAGHLRPGSARAVVLRDGGVLVVRDPDSRHILPGGRCEPGETLEQTVHREALEETGWAVVVLGLLCVLRFRHRRPKPTGYSYPYPEFYQAIYCATAASFHPQAQQCGGYELGAEFQPVPAVRHLTLTPGEQVFLRAAVASEAFRQFQ